MESNSSPEQIQPSFKTTQQQRGTKGKMDSTVFMTSLFACSYTSVWLKFLCKQGFVSHKIGFLLALARATQLSLLLALCQKGKLDAQEDLCLLHKVLSIEIESESHTDVPRKAIKSSGPISQNKIGHGFVCCLFCGFFLNQVTSISCCLPGASLNHSLSYRHLVLRWKLLGQ